MTTQINCTPDLLIAGLDNVGDFLLAALEHCAGLGVKGIAAGAGATFSSAGNFGAKIAGVAANASFSPSSSSRPSRGDSSPQQARAISTPPANVELSDSYSNIARNIESISASMTLDTGYDIGGLSSGSGLSISAQPSQGMASGMLRA